MKDRHGRAACNLLDWCDGTWFWGFKGLKFQTIKMSLLFRGHRHAKHKQGLKLTSSIFLIIDLKRTFIPARSSDQSPGGSVGRAPLHRIMGFPSVPGLQMLHQNSRALFAVRNDGTERGIYRFQQVLLWKIRTKNNRAPCCCVRMKRSTESQRWGVFFLSLCLLICSPALTPETPRGEEKSENSTTSEFYIVFIWVWVVLV